MAGLLLPNLGLPSLTGSCAHDAKTVGAFGLVWWPLTNAYQPPDLGLGRPSICFTNHYHRTGGEGGLGVDPDASGWVVRWLGKVARVIIA